MIRTVFSLCLLAGLLLNNTCNYTAKECARVKGKFTDSLSFTYLRMATVFQAGDEYLVRLKKSWQGDDKSAYSYLLTPDEEQYSDCGNEKLSVIQVPVSKVVCLSTTHIGYIDALGQTDKICAVSGSRYVYNGALRQAHQEGKLADVGESTSLNYEKILSLAPDLVLAFGVDAGSAKYIKRLQELGLRVMIIPEYLEETPLGKAEWIKVFALLFDKKGAADSLFRESESKYLQLSRLANKAQNRPAVCVSLPWKDTWWVPGGRSLTAQLISDAGGRYLWEDEASREAIGLSLEAAWIKARQADVWINTGAANNKADILSVEKRLADIPVFTSGRVYNNNARCIPGGGVDYWESGVVRPDVVLKDLINILHPGLSSDSSLYYYHRLE